MHCYDDEGKEREINRRLDFRYRKSETKCNKTTTVIMFRRKQNLHIQEQRHENVEMAFRFMPLEQLQIHAVCFSCKWNIEWNFVLFGGLTEAIVCSRSCAHGYRVPNTTIQKPLCIHNFSLKIHNACIRLTWSKVFFQIIVKSSEWERKIRREELNQYTQKMLPSFPLTKHLIK